MNDFDQLVQDALQAEFSGWDFSYLDGRWHQTEPVWDYRKIVTDQLPGVRSLLDMGTGGGEFLSSLPGLPSDTAATEGYSPNIPIAQARLEPLGISVFEVHDDAHLPFPDGRFDLVINRHESYSPGEVYRILAPGGKLISQQVGGMDNRQLNELLQDHVHSAHEDWNAAVAVAGLLDAGFHLLDAREAFPPTVFYDVGALVYYLKAIPWQIEEFSVESHRDRLLKVHQMIQELGKLETRSHRFLVIVQK